MRSAALPATALGGERMIRIDPTLGEYAHHRVAELPQLLRSGDLLVVNDAAVLPASLRTVGGDVELRLIKRGATDSEWTAIVLGEGNFRTPTEQRPEPTPMRAGQRLELEGGMTAEVTGVDRALPRVVEIRFALSGAQLFVALYRSARPIQYSYLERELELWHFQNRFAARPWALEPPSAGYCLSWELITSLRSRGIALGYLTHAAGISSTGSPELDRRLPLPERYEIGERLVAAVRGAQARRGRVVAVGTTVVRALEASFADHGCLSAAAGEARLVIGPGFRPKVTDAVLSGMHASGTSHFALLRAFADGALLRRALEAAESVGYLEHEFGDLTLVLRSQP